MSIEKLKEQARRHEQKEEWLKALDQYKKAIDKLAEDDQPDIGLYNRVGDLFVRVGNLSDAVEHYEQAVDLYMEAELPNNAIAVCKKVIRNVPDRYQIYLKMGEIRAQQGFMPDARTNYLTYAERAAQAGEQDESLRVLVEFVGRAPEDTEMRLFVAEQLAAHERVDEAVEHFIAAHQRLTLTGEAEQAASVEGRIRELAPDADLTAAPAAPAAFEGSSLADDGEIYAQFGEIELSGGDETSDDAPEEASPAPAIEAAMEESSSDEGGVSIGEFEIAEFEESPAAEESDEAAEDLPLVSFDPQDDDGDDVVELPLMDAGDADAGDDEDGGGFELPLMDVEDDDDEAAPDLPLMSFDDDDADAEAEADPLPTLDVEQDDDEDTAFELPTLDVDDDGSEKADAPEETQEAGDDPGAPAAPSEAPSAPSQDAFAYADAEQAGGDDEPTVEEMRSRIAQDPADVSLHQRFVEVAYGSGDPATQAEAYLGLAGALTLAGQGARAKAAYQQVLAVDPSNEAALAGLDSVGAAPSRPVKEVAANEDYVDLGSLLLGDDEEKSTRFVVAYEEPSGDEDADFAKMLSQFKSKVSENLDADDVRAHHDLGTAYKEMGLLDEAIAEYQQALRASANHLATYEMMGLTFMDMGKPDQAIRALERAIKIDFEVEDELVGIYYHLARAYEDTGEKEKAVEFYDRVFSLDINFADVTERLRALR